jgi:hypothetical protein
VQLEERDSRERDRETERQRDRETERQRQDKIENMRGALSVFQLTSASTFYPTPLSDVL